MLVLAALVAGASPSAAQTGAAGRVVVAVLPYGTTVEEIAAVPGLAPGLVSAGLGAVPVAQTFLDIGQGNRVNENLYDGDLPRLYVRDGEVPPRLWERTLERAESAPANVDPGLLGSTLLDAGVPVRAEADSGLATLIGVNRDGTVEIAEPSSCVGGCGPGLSVVRMRLGELPALARRLGPDDMLIAIAAGAGDQQELLPTGIGGAGYDGNLTSASTRTDGVVLSTDIAPTVLEHLGVEVPSAVNGAEIVSSSDRDPGEVADLQTRLDHRPSRDTSVLLPLGIWLVLTALASAVWRARGARPALRLLALSCAWAPLVLLVVAAPDAGPLAAALAVGLGSPALAAVTDRVLGGCAGLAFACAATVLAYAIDVIAGSPLTALSILGPNPGAGVRFFGIGNELEAILTTLTLIGTGAWLTDRDARRAARRSAAVEAPDSTRRSLEPRGAAIRFGAIAALAAAAFAPGRFGADVGAAIVLGVGGATAAVLALGLERRRAIAVVVGGGALGLVALLAIDTVLGGAHLSRSVLGAGDAHDVLDVLDRRLRLMTRTFIHPVYPQLLAISLVLLVTGVVRRRRVLAWFDGRRWALAGFLGALAGILVGTVANDSGSVLLVIGMIYISVSAGFFWATSGVNEAGG